MRHKIMLNNQNKNNTDPEVDFITQLCYSVKFTYEIDKVTVFIPANVTICHKSTLHQYKNPTKYFHNSQFKNAYIVHIKCTDMSFPSSVRFATTLFFIYLV